MFCPKPSREQISCLPPLQKLKKSVCQKKFAELSHDEKNNLTTPPEIKRKSFCQKQHKLGCPRPPQIKKLLTKWPNSASENDLKRNRH